MVKLIAVFISLTLVGHLCAALTAQLDKTESLESESVTLMVIHEGSRGNIEPDWSVLNQSFDYYVTNTMTSMQYINGRMGSSTRWEVLLRPKEAGLLTIPPITVGSEETQSLTLQVNPLEQSVKDDLQRDAFIELTVSPEEQYVQAGIRVSRKIYNVPGVRYSGTRSNFGILPLPVIENARVVPIGSGETYNTVREGRLFGITSQEFLVFAEKSGVVIIPASSVTAHFPRTRTRPAIAFNIGHPEKEIRILPIPPEYPRDTPWLPASQLDITQQLIPQSLESLSIGDSFVRTIKVTAEDTLAAGIPDIDTDVGEGISVYSDPPSHEDLADERGVRGIRTQTDTFVARRTGEYEIDPVSLTWWDTESREVKESTLEGIIVGVTGDFVSQAEDNSSPNSAALANVNPGAKATADDAPLGTTLLSSNRLFFWIPVLSGWVVAVLLTIYIFASRKGFANRANAKTQVESLKRRLRSKDLDQVKRAMIDWVMKQNDISRATAAQAIMQDEYLSNIFSKINAILYGNHQEQFDFDVKRVVVALSALKPSVGSRSEPSVLLEYYT